MSISSLFVPLLFPFPSRLHENKNNPLLALIKISEYLFTMIGSTLARVSRPVVARQQRRGIVDWMTNYPDKVSII